MISRKLVPIAGALAILAAAQTALADQGNPLVGIWQHTYPGNRDMPPSTWSTSYSQNGAFETRIAVPAGVLVVEGTYQITGQGTYEFTSMSAEMCAAGSFCSPYPPAAMVFHLGSVQQGSFGVDDGISMPINGESWLRVQ